MMASKIAIVTGGSRGIGAAICKRLAADGFTVVVNFTSNQTAADSVVSDIQSKGGSAVAIKADVSKADDVKQLFDHAVEKFQAQKVDLVVNNAALMDNCLIADLTDEGIDKLVDVNVKGAVYVMREAVNRLNKGGSLINVSTSVIGMKRETYGLYSATKAAIDMLTPILAKEMRGRDITVNCIAPGPTATELFFKGKSDELVQTLTKMVPLERLGVPDDIANVVSFLAGPDGKWVNGQILRANGGIV